MSFADVVTMAASGDLVSLHEVARSVAVGKSTTARILRAILGAGTGNPSVELITSDGFCIPMPPSKNAASRIERAFPRVMTDVEWSSPIPL